MSPRLSVAALSFLGCAALAGGCSSDDSHTDVGTGSPPDAGNPAPLDAGGTGDATSPRDAGASDAPATPAEGGAGDDSAITDANTSGDTSSDGAPDGAPADATAPCDDDGGAPAELRCTGLYSDWGSKVVAPDVHYYDPGLKLWSDGAVKRRWIRLPPGTQIDSTDMDNWVFPVGTKIWKEFNLGGQLDTSGQVTGGKTIETRLLWKESATRWTTVVYRWSDDQTSTHRLINGEKVPQDDGGPDYEVPSTAACGSCHGGRADFVLGFDPIGLGVPQAGATGGLTLATLPAGWLTVPPPVTTIAIPEDDTGMAAAALGFLHMNCGVSCHNAKGMAGPVGLYTKLLMTQMYPEGGTGDVASLDTYTTSVNQTSRLYQGQYKRILPGNSAQSLIPLMALSRGGDAGFLAMPPLLTHRVDMDPATGVPAVQAWVDALTP
jgi:hypothetical protein